MLLVKAAFAATPLPQGLLGIIARSRCSCYIHSMYSMHSPEEDSYDQDESYSVSQNSWPHRPAPASIGRVACKFTNLY
jgi:hypothetical protein